MADRHLWKWDATCRCYVERVCRNDCEFGSRLQLCCQPKAAASRQLLKQNMMMQILGSFAEFERAMHRECTRSSVLTAREQGRISARRPDLTTRQQDEIVHLVNSGQKTAADSARLFNVHPSTVARLLARSKLIK